MAMVHPLRVLRGLYLGRLTLAAGIFGGALLVWPRITPETTLIATLLLLVTLGVTLPSYWHTHVRGRAPGRGFLHAQAVFDTLLVTAVVHLTGGGESDFASLYILVLAVAALLLPLSGAMMIGALASLLYLGDLVWWHTAPPPATVFVQMGLFVLMALVAGALGDRLRKAGTALGEMASELRQLRLETDDILGAIETGVATIDADGRLVYLNAAGEALLGLSARDWRGRPVLAELERRAPGLGRMVEKTVETGTPLRRQELAGGPAAEGRVWGARTTILERDGRPWVTLVFQDITDGKRLEELDRQTARLQAVAALAASLAHEIKNPLASIRSAVEQLTADGLAAEDREVLQRLVLSESDRLSRLLSEFIEFSRVELRRREPVDLVAITQDAIRLVVQHPDGANGARVEFQAPDQPLLVDGDEDLLHRAVFNLVLNAVQHAGPEGAVRVELGSAAPRTLPPGVNLAAPVRLAVSDTGPGIKAEDRSRIFDPFFTRRKGGTGLGLALVHRAVEAHHGAIFVDNGPRGGAQFTMYLPGRPEEKG